MRSETRRNLVGYVRWGVIGGVIGVVAGFYFISRPLGPGDSTPQTRGAAVERSLVGQQGGVAEFARLPPGTDVQVTNMPEDQLPQSMQPHFVVSIATPREQPEPYVAALLWRTSELEDEDPETALKALKCEELPTPVRGALKEEAVFLKLSGENGESDSESNSDESSQRIRRWPSYVVSDFAARMDAIHESDVTEEEIPRAKDIACSIDDPLSKSRALLLVHAAEEKRGEATTETLKMAAQARSDMNYLPLLLGLFLAPAGVFCKAFINEIGESFGQAITLDGSSGSGSD